MDPDIDWMLYEQDTEAARARKRLKERFKDAGHYLSSL